MKKDQGRVLRREKQGEEMDTMSHCLRISFDVAEIETHIESFFG